MRVVAGSDHAGLSLKNGLLERLKGKGIEVEDVGTHDAASVDYPDYAQKVAEKVAANPGTLGLLVCGTGQGMAMAANRVDGIRAAVVGDCFSAKAVRQHNNANVLCLGERVTGAGLAGEILDLFLSTPFEGGRHAGRVEKMMALSRRNA